MKAAVRSRYGNAEAVEIVTVDEPVPGPEDVLVRVHAVSLNASDWEFVIDRIYALDEAREALCQLGSGKAAGKVIVVVEPRPVV